MVINYGLIIFAFLMIICLFIPIFFGINIVFATLPSAIFLVVSIMFWCLLKSPNFEGRQLLDSIRAFKHYLSEHFTSREEFFLWLNRTLFALRNCIRDREKVDLKNT